MITVEKAKSILINNSIELTATHTVKVADALGCRLAEDIHAQLDLPPFDQSNVDGYAVRSSSNENNSWKVIAEIKAGDNSTIELKEGEAVRIFTGAMVPENSDCVIMQEKIIRKENIIQFTEKTLKKAEHIRNAGSQIKKGSLALNKGITLNPAVIGFISALGLTEISVFKKPKIALIITGDELQTPGKPLEPGKVYESNSLIIQSVLAEMGLTIDKLFFAKDDKKSLVDTINRALPDTDLLLISGGISVGDYDFVNEVLNENNTKTLFYKIAQKPGKPLFFGKNDNTLIFGLPGNPSSVLTCFYEYVYPALRKMLGREDLFLNSVQAPILSDFTKKQGLSHFLKAKIDNSGVQPLEGQESFKLKSFAEANAFIYLPMEKEDIKMNELVEVHILPKF
jgi:molybdopterin molybdotransferase